MIWLLRDFDLFSVLLRAATLSLEALALGGIFFLTFVAIPAGASSAVFSSIRRITAWFALALAFVQVALATVSSAVLIGSSDLKLGDVLSANYFIADCALAISALLLFFLLRSPWKWALPASIVPALFVVAASVALSHAASRLEYRGLLLAFTAVHHLGMAAWIGALPHLFIALRKSESQEAAWKLVHRFSPLAIVAVALLVGAGLGMAWLYTGSWSALYGTSYGVMLVAKTYLLLITLLLGGMNFLLAREHAPLLMRLRRFTEAEIGLGFTAILVAASLTSQPPATDLVQDRLTKQEIAQRAKWQWPSFQTPSLAELTPPSSIEVGMRESIFTGGKPNDANDRAWSEYNHHWAGLIVLVAGVFALLARMPQLRWARNWPLLFIGLAIFILLRADPENWPLGPRPFWASFSAPDVLEHRFYALLIMAFAFFEWAVETGRLKWQKASLIFPAICALGGALLMTHSHSLGNVKDEMFAEMSHTPIALLGATAGWSRWLELRLPDRRGTRLAAWLWPVCLMLLGIVLLDYRES